MIISNRGEKMKDTKSVVREAYAKIATKGSSCCSSSSCCSDRSTSSKIGYTDEDISSVPNGADLGLGCGNPVALASLKKGDVVVDLGSGGGFDCFLAADRVTEAGKVIGVDMTPGMIDRARKNAAKGGYTNIEFRLGEIEHLPVADGSVDVVISNCVINLAPDKSQVFNETFRVLKPGGRIMISDIVLLKKLPDAIMDSAAAYVGCISGAIMKDEYIKLLELSGFSEVTVVSDKSFSLDCMTNDPTAQAIIEDQNIPIDILLESARSVISIQVSAVKGLD